MLTAKSATAPWRDLHVGVSIKFFGTKPKGNILDVIQGEKNLGEIITPVIPGIDLISGGSGLTEFNRMSPFERRALDPMSPVAAGHPTETA